MTRAEVEEKWTALAEGRVTSADVHTWADRHIRETGDEPLANHGLQDLHGLSGQSFRGSSDDVFRRLAEWREECAAYDRDPEGWRAERMRQAASGLGIE